MTISQTNCLLGANVRAQKDPGDAPEHVTSRSRDTMKTTGEINPLLNCHGIAMTLYWSPTSLYIYFQLPYGNVINESVIAIYISILVSHRSEYKSHMFVNILLYIFM